MPAIVVHGLLALVRAPDALPWLWVQACTTYSFLMFVVMLGKLHHYQWLELSDEPEMKQKKR